MWQCLLILPLICYSYNSYFLSYVLQGYDGFSGFHFSLLASALLLQKKINRLMSCYQIFRVGLQHLCSSDWTSSGFLSASSSSPSAPPLSSFHAAFDVVFVDSTGFLNVCADMSKERYRWLQHEASLALKLLDDSTSHGFQALFMTTMPVEQMFDILYRYDQEESCCNIYNQL